MAQFIKNTDKEYKCTQCSSDNVSIIREDPKGVNPRLKCSDCSFMFNGKDSLSAIEAGAIKPSSEASLAEANDPETITLEVNRSQANVVTSKAKEIPSVSSEQLFHQRVARTPAYLFISRRANSLEIISKKNFKKTAIKWAQAGPFEVYSLTQIKLNVKVDIEK